MVNFTFCAFYLKNPTVIYDAFLAWDRRQKCKMLAVIVASQPTESSIQYSLRTTTWTIENKHHRTLKKKWAT